jgi:hypothetical protein
MAKSIDERRKDAQVKELAKTPDGRSPGNHMSDVTLSNDALSNDAFYSEVFADRNVRPIESMQGNYAKCRDNSQPKHKGRKQL